MLSRFSRPVSTVSASFSIRMKNAISRARTRLRLTELHFGILPLLKLCRKKKKESRLTSALCKNRRTPLWAR